MKWFRGINWIMFPAGLNLYPLVEVRKSYNLSTGKIRKNLGCLLLKILTDILSKILFILAITTQSTFVITTGLQLSVIGIEGLNLFTKFMWSTALISHIGFNRKKIRSLVGSINDIIISDVLTRKRLFRLSQIAVTVFLLFIASEVAIMYEMLNHVGTLHYFKMYSVTSSLERLVRQGCIKLSWFEPTNNETFLNMYQRDYPVAFLIESVVQHGFYIFFMSGSLYMFTTLVTVISVAISKIYVWKLNDLKEVMTKQSRSGCEWQVSTINEMRSLRVRVQKIRLAIDHIFSLPVLISLGILFLDTGIRLSVKQMKMKGGEEYMKKYIFWLGIMFHAMKSLTHILMIVLLDNVYEEADTAEINMIESMIELSKVRKVVSDGGTTSVVLEQVFEHKKCDSIQMMILEMMNDKLHRLTAWNMFIVQKSVILAFLGSVIPFAVIVVGFFEQF